MEFVLVFPLILSVLSIRQNHQVSTEQANESCYDLCPAGYHSIGRCDGPNKKYKCERCKEKTFTEIPNYKEHCISCSQCGRNEDVLRPCNYNSDVVCGCALGFFRTGSNVSHPCTDCECESCTEFRSGSNSIRCLACHRQECLQLAECKADCRAATTATASTQGEPVKAAVAFPWTFILLTVLIWLLLCFACLLCYSHELIYAGVNEACSLPGSRGLTTTTLDICEETPMMSTDAPGAHVTVQKPHAEHKATGHEEQPERWPAVVLYSIIKEVPLRRWKEFLRLLSVADQEMERVELEAGLGLGLVEKQYQMLRLWSQRSTAGLGDVFSALRYMDLSGCAQLLQESLEKQALSA